jgi:Flp pilus assembly protein TadD
MKRVAALLFALLLGSAGLSPNVAHADEAEAQYRLALSHKRAGHLDEAIAAAQRATELRPDYADAYYTLGTLLRQQRRYQEALAAFCTTTQLRPRYASAYAMKGAMLRRLNRHEHAVAVLARAVRLDPNDISSWANLGASYRSLGRLDEASDAYDRGLAVAPNDPGLLSNLAVLYRQQGGARRRDHRAEPRHRVPLRRALRGRRAALRVRALEAAERSRRPLRPRPLLRAARPPGRRHRHP